MRYLRSLKLARRLGAIILAPSLIAMACSSSVNGGYACTAVFVYGISATATDAVTGANIANGASLIVREGVYVDSQPSQASMLMAAGERPGTYDVTVRRAGYVPFTKTGVKVEKDICHVIPVTVAAVLQPAP